MRYPVGQSPKLFERAVEEDLERLFGVDFFRLDGWLLSNYQKGPRNNGTEMVVKTGTDFLTNAPVLQLTPRVLIRKGKRNGNGQSYAQTNGKPLEFEEISPLERSRGLYGLLGYFGASEAIYRTGEVIVDSEKANAVLGTLNTLLGLHEGYRARVVGRRNGTAHIRLNPEVHAAYRGIVKSVK